MPTGYAELGQSHRPGMAGGWYSPPKRTGSNGYAGFEKTEDPGKVKMVRDK